MSDIDGDGHRLGRVRRGELADDRGDCRELGDFAGARRSDRGSLPVVHQGTDHLPRRQDRGGPGLGSGPGGRHGGGRCRLSCAEGSEPADRRGECRGAAGRDRAGFAVEQFRRGGQHPVLGDDHRRLRNLVRAVPVRAKADPDGRQPDHQVQPDAGLLRCAVGCDHGDHCECDGPAGEFHPHRRRRGVRGGLLPGMAWRASSAPCPRVAARRAAPRAGRAAPPQAGAALAFRDHRGDLDHHGSGGGPSVGADLPGGTGGALNAPSAPDARRPRACCAWRHREWPRAVGNGRRLPSP